MSEQKPFDLKTSLRPAWMPAVPPTTVGHGSTVPVQTRKSRHETLSHTLNDFSNYKSWTDKIKKDWAQEK